MRAVARGSTSASTGSTAASSHRAVIAFSSAVSNYGVPSEFCSADMLFLLRSFRYANAKHAVIPHPNRISADISTTRAEATIRNNALVSRSTSPDS